MEDRDFDEKIYFESLGKIEKINQILKDLQESDISGTLLYKLEFYIRFIKNLDDRISFLLEIKSKYKKEKHKKENYKSNLSICYKRYYRQKSLRKL